MTGSYLTRWHEWRAALAPLPAVRSTGEMPAALTTMQAGLCGLCLDDGLRLVLDHDHFSGFARGMLCRGCNTAEGKLDSDLLSAYRANPPAAGMGWIWDELGLAGVVMRVRGGREKWRMQLAAAADEDLIGFDYPVIREYLDDLMSEQARLTLLAQDWSTGHPRNTPQSQRIAAEPNPRIPVIRMMAATPGISAADILKALSAADPSPLAG